jgi:thiamine-monophosphate kinase
MKELGEFEIIRQFFARETADDSVLLGIGDDAAILDPAAMRGSVLAVSVDALVEGVHFPRGFDPGLVGHRALAVNLSDMAAMGAEPRWWTLVLALPHADPDWLEAFSRAAFGLAHEHSATLIGGDLTRGPLSVSVQLMGTVPAGAFLRRDGAGVGHQVFVTGSLGDAAGGLRLLNTGNYAVQSPQGRLIERFCRPSPRVAVGRALRTLASAAIDVSDGLAADLGHVCEASGVGAEIDLERLPLSPELVAAFGAGEARSLALSGGDDYELCFTVAPEKAVRIDRLCTEIGVPVRRIGQIVEGDAVRSLRDGTALDPATGGYTHF